METFVTVAAILGMIVIGVLLIRLLNSQHGDRMAAVHYGRSGIPVQGPAPSARRKAHGRLRLRHRDRDRDHERGQAKHG
ncbi:hypothetical protein ACFC4C_20835 [Streptomyces sp. NPDC056039]|uniref:hypothetical protein n=1 Tax=Streptomyces sp. NPDC056039 TaxID=3345687 RepID=UPI0035DB87E9